jgi:tetratricopeptide (TPR) repeat protein
VDRKSQIAIEYAFRFKQSHPQHHVFWVYAASRNRFIQAYQDIAQRLRLPRHDDPAVDVCKLVLDWLAEEDTQWLMIIDNVDDPELFFRSKEAEPSAEDTSASKNLLIKYLPSRLSSSKLLLITTRSTKVGCRLSNREQCIDVPPFNDEEALLLLQQRPKDPATSGRSLESDELLKELEYIPLAISQAAAFIRENDMSFGEYLTSLKKNKQNLEDYLTDEQFDDRRDGERSSAVFLTWKFSFDQIRKQEPLSAEVLSLMALFDRRDIPQSLLKYPQDSDVDFIKATGTLKAFSLIVQEADSTTLSMHPLVQHSIQFWLKQNKEKVKYEEQALQQLASEFPYLEHENREICGRLYPHAQVVLGYNPTSESSKKARGDLLCMVGWYDQVQGNYGVAEKNVLEALRLFEEVLAMNSPESLKARYHLGIILIDQGKYEKAEQMFKVNLRTDETLLGERHHKTLQTMHQLARTFQLQGKYKEAEKMFRKTLKSKVELVGENHPSYQATMNELAMTLRKQSKNKEAEEMFLQVLKFGETVLGKKHPDTLSTMHNLALILGDQQKYDEAEEMFRNVLKLSEPVLREEHPKTLMTMHNLASVLAGQNKYDEAEEMCQHVLKLRETVLGKEHPDTLMTMHSLALVLAGQNKYDEAEEICQHVLKLRETVLGKEHPDTLIAACSLASVYKNQERVEEAETFWQ